MTLKLQKRLAMAAFNLSVVMMIIFVMLAWFLPYFVSMWAEIDAPLAGWQVMLSKASGVATAHKHWLVVVLGVLIVCTIIWRVAVGIFLWLASRQTPKTGEE